METVRLTAEQVQPLRRGAPSRHVLDEDPETLYLGSLRSGHLVGVLSAFAESPPAAGTSDWQLYGPYGEGGLELVEEMARLVGAGARLWADSPRPGLAERDGIWERTTEPPPPAPAAYNAPEIRVLRGLEAIRRRPRMYVGSTGPAGIDQLLWELVNNAVDQHLAGRLTRLQVWSDGVGVAVTDDGPGIDPYLLHRHFTSWHSGATADGDRKHVHVAGSGVGVVVVNALSSRLVVTSDREGRRWQETFERGRPVGAALDVGSAARTGTSVWFTPDPAIFPDPTVDLGRARPTLVDLAHLNPRLHIELQGEVLDGGAGLITMAERLAGGEGRRLVAKGEHARVHVDVAVAWGAREPATFGWANQLRSSGSHVRGLTDALAGTPEDRVALVAVELMHPHWAGRTRDELEVDAARDAVARVVEAALRASTGGPTTGGR